jgi:hypothetical protein
MYASLEGATLTHLGRSCQYPTPTDGYVKMPDAALRLILRHCGVRNSTPHSSGIARLACDLFTKPSPLHDRLRLIPRLLTPTDGYVKMPDAALRLMGSRFQRTRSVIDVDTGGVL